MWQVKFLITNEIWGSLGNFPQKMKKIVIKKLDIFRIVNPSSRVQFILK
jgi:hypothetical protein